MDKYKAWSLLLEFKDVIESMAKEHESVAKLTAEMASFERLADQIVDAMTGESD